MRTMEHDPNHFPQGVVGSSLCIFFSVFAWISLQQAQLIATLIATGFACASGYFAARYYYYAAKEKKNNLFENYKKNKPS